HCGGSANANGSLIGIAAVLQSPDQNCDVRPLPSPVSMQLIEHDELQTAGVLYDCLIDFVLAGEHKLRHHKVCEQDIWRRSSNAIALFLLVLTRVASDQWPDLVR